MHTPSRSACDLCIGPMGRAGGSGLSHTDFAGSVPQFAIQHHFESRTLRQHQIRSAGQQYTRKARGGATRGADPYTHGPMSRNASGDGAYARAGAGRFTHGAGIAAFISFTADFAFLTIYFMAVCV